MRSRCTGRFLGAAICKRKAAISTEFKTNLMDEASMERTLRRLAHEIVEKNRGVQNLCLIGILRRGVPLAQRLAANIQMIENAEIPVGTLDITLYRDDISQLGDQATVNSTHVPFEISGKTVVLVDDVLYTGRTARAAMEAVIALGRPAVVQLCTLVDRGHRELPVCANFVGKNFPTARSEMVRVCMPEYDDCMKVDLYSVDRDW